MKYPIRQKYFKSYDGTKIGYQVVGEGSEPFILCNGLGGTMIAWSPLYDELGDRFRFITWDYRGLFTSACPKDYGTLTIPGHVHDLAALLAHEKIATAFFGGWSMGVQVLLEHYKAAPDAFRGIFMINGTSGNPFHTALNSPLSRYILPRVNELAKKVMPALEPHIKPLAKLVIDRKGFVKILCILGMTHERIRADIIKKIATDMMETNLSMYHEIVTHLAEHSAADVLPHIRVPTLIISGTRDIVTPSRLAEDMAEKIPNAELMIVNEGSHYVLLEFPDIVSKRLRRFLEEHFPMTRPKRKLSAKRKIPPRKKLVPNVK